MIYSPQRTQGITEEYFFILKTLCASGASVFANIYAFKMNIYFIRGFIYLIWP